MADAYEVAIEATDDETFSFTLPIQQSDGTAFPWSSYSFEYAVTTECGAQVFTLAPVLTPGVGIYVDTTSGSVTFKNVQGCLGVGSYRHGCRIRHVTTGDTIQIFTGPVTITDGGF